MKGTMLQKATKQYNALFLYLPTFLLVKAAKFVNFMNDIDHILLIATF